MKERTSKVEALLEKKGIEKEGEYKEMFPEKIEEIEEYLRAQDIKDSTFFQYAWRGRTLSFQGAGEPLSEEEKEARKAVRKVENESLKALREKAKEQGVGLAELLKKMLG